MDYHGDNGHQLGRLVAPQRNNYFYGKLMDVLHFQMEQTYGNRKRWLLNRLSLGEGVLCGLEVQRQNGQVCVTPGVAIDALGREIIVSVGLCVDPWTLTNECGAAANQLSKEAEHLVHICLAYDECSTDYTPVLVTDCNTRSQCAPGTIVESFRLLVHEGSPAPLPPGLDHELCQALIGAGGQAHKTTAERRQLLCQRLAGPCPTPSEQPCVPLATVQLLPDETIGAIDTCTFRPRVYSNAMLLELILCLAERIEECCASAPTPIPTPLQIQAVELLNQQGQIRGSLSLENADNPQQVIAANDVNAIRVTFTKAVDQTTVTAGDRTGDPKTFSFLVQASWSHFGGDQYQYVPGEIVPEPSDEMIRFVISTDPDISTNSGAFRAGSYRVTLFGEADQASGRRGITATDGTRLGGNFVFSFLIPGS